MVEQDTVKLLRECDQGVRMGIDSLEDVMQSVHNSDLKKIITDCKSVHVDLQNKICGELSRFQDKGKQPNVMAKSMSWIKTNVKLGLEPNDHTVADLLTEGCDMGVRSLSRYLNQYQAADENSKTIAKDLIRSEADLSVALRAYL